MPEILLTPELLRSEAQKFTSYQNNLNDAVKQIESLVNKLPDGWRGKAQQAFINSFTEKKSTYDKFSVELGEFAKFMNEYASAMETTDDGSIARLNF